MKWFEFVSKNLYKKLFWIGYIILLLTAIIPIGGNLSKKHVGSALRLDYFIHFVVYFSICLYFAIGRYYRLRLFKRRSVLKFIVLIVFLASFTELIQMAVPTRSFNPMDWVANITGVGIGLLVFWSAGLLVGKSVRNVGSKE